LCIKQCQKYFTGQLELQLSGISLDRNSRRLSRWNPEVEVDPNQLQTVANTDATPSG
jgi:hypothetical protein